MLTLRTFFYHLALTRLSLPKIFMNALVIWLHVNVNRVAEIFHSPWWWVIFIIDVGGKKGSEGLGASITITVIGYCLLMLVWVRCAHVEEGRMVCRRNMLPVVIYRQCLGPWYTARPPVSLLRAPSVRVDCWRAKRRREAMWVPWAWI